MSTRARRASRKSMLSSLFSYIIFFICFVFLILFIKLIFMYRDNQYELIQLRHENVILENKIRNLINNQLMLSNSYTDLIGTMNDRAEEKVKLLSNLNKSLMKMVNEDHEIAVLVKETGVLEEIKVINQEIEENSKKAESLYQQSQRDCSSLGLKLPKDNKLKEVSEFGINTNDYLECYLESENLKTHPHQEQ